MNLPKPSPIPTNPLCGGTHPMGYAGYGGYKPWLRDEFTFRCVYCLEREAWYPDRDASFSTDHFDPKLLSPERESEYTNLVYACTRCNSLKRAELALLDPMIVGFGRHLRINGDGSIVALSPQGQQLIDLLHLDVSPANEVREEYLLLLQAKREQPTSTTPPQLGTGMAERHTPAI
jgi:hypothetical protein